MRESAVGTPSRPPRLPRVGLTKGVFPMAPASPLTGPVVKCLTEARERRRLNMKGERKTNWTTACCEILVARNGVNIVSLITCTFSALRISGSDYVRQFAQPTELSLSSHFQYLHLILQRDEFRSNQNAESMPGPG